MPDFSNYDTVKKLFEEDQDAENDNRELAEEAHDFVDEEDGQWEQHAITNSDDKPRYTFDQTSPIIDQISGDIDESDFDIRIIPRGSGATKDGAELRNGMVRNIQSLTSAQHIFSDAARKMVTAGIDGWRVTTGFADDNSFDQDLMIKPVQNFIRRVWFDKSASLQDKSDSRWGTLLSELTKADYEEQFKGGSGLSVSDGQQNSSECHNADGVTIANFFYETFKDRTLVKTSLGRVFEGESEEFLAVKDELAAAGEVVTDTRTIKDRIFFMRKFDGGGWLGEPEETVFSFVPLIPCYANYKIKKKETIYYGAVKKAMDPQRVFNYAKSREIEEGALAPRIKYWATDKQVEGHTDTLATMNTNADPVQLYTHDPDVPGAPQQSGGAQITPGLNELSGSMQNLMSTTSGIFAAGMGDNPGLQSGVAIGRLQDKGNNVTSKFFKSMEIPICHTGRILVDAFPKVYDSERQIGLLSADGSVDFEDINQVVFDEETQKDIVLNNLAEGKYGVVCKAAKSFDSRQQETVSGLMEFAKFDPTILQTGQDIILNNLNTPGVDKMAERSRAQLLKAGVIPQSQWTDEEKAQAEAAAQQPKEPDAAMALAQAEQTKANAELGKVQVASQRAQVEMMKAQNSIALEIEKLNLMKSKLEFEAEKTQFEFSEKIAKLNRETQQQEFDQMIALRDQAMKASTTAVDNLNTQADTLKKIREGMGVDTITGPHGVQDFVQQAVLIGDAQNAT